MTKVGPYRLVEFVLERPDGYTVSTILNLDPEAGLWRARTPEGSAATFAVPAGVPDPPTWIARRLVT